MGACSSKKSLQHRHISGHTNSRLVNDNRSTTSVASRKTIKAASDREKQFQKQHQQLTQQQFRKKQQQKRMVATAVPSLQLSDNDDDIAEQDPIPLAKKLNLKRDSIAVTKVRLSRTHHDKGAITIKEEEDTCEIVSDAAAEQSTDRVHFNTPSALGEDDGNVGLPNDWGLSLHSNYSTATASDPGTGRLVTVS
ncbi:hypothetical protein BIW11_08358 [Tropilaelaps mercedesae]|uniref:Uncharacterized protein n=1 Tax=Tropilaelaps mercedesae TaxID=418985 RepID=A0A1V9XPY4_9ACAR|nr:hypothetical protein BIW11_08358 [Tropilaelaps mercedesae]